MEKTFRIISKKLIINGFMCLSLFGIASTALAFDKKDGPGDSCDEVKPQGCTKAQNHVIDQDNGYHNTLQALHGVKEKTVNVIEVTPETDTAPATYTTTKPPKYKGKPAD